MTLFVGWPWAAFANISTMTYLARLSDAARPGAAGQTGRGDLLLVRAEARLLLPDRVVVIRMQVRHVVALAGVDPRLEVRLLVQPGQELLCFLHVRGEVEDADRPGVGHVIALPRRALGVERNPDVGSDIREVALGNRQDAGGVDRVGDLLAEE